MVPTGIAEEAEGGAVVISVAVTDSRTEHERGLVAEFEGFLDPEFVKPTRRRATPAESLDRAVGEIDEAFDEPVVHRFVHVDALDAAAALAGVEEGAVDDILDRIPANGGLVMATFVPPFVSQPRQNWERPFQTEFGASKYPGGERLDLFAEHEKKVGAKPDVTIGNLCDHLDYLRERIGEDHIGIGSDFFGGPRVQGLEDVGRFPDLFAELVRRDWSEKALLKLAGRNFLRVFRACEAAVLAHGGMGYAEEPATSRYFVDARVLSIFEGAEETLALKVVARALFERALGVTPTAG